MVPLYAFLYRSTLEERLAMLEAHQHRVREQIAELQSHLAVIDFKSENYKHLETNRNWAGVDCLDIREQTRKRTGSRESQPEGQRGIEE